MTFPAELTFKHDRTLSSSACRVYGYLTTILAFHEDRSVKSQVHAGLIGVSRESFGLALDALAAAGYLVEGQRDLHNVRRFRLAWSIQLAERDRAG
jgi:hypothetical protein